LSQIEYYLRFYQMYKAEYFQTSKY